MEVNNVILIGAGRYGNGLVGRKYAQGKIEGAELSAVVDPNIDQIAQSSNYVLGKASAYDSFEKIPESAITEDTVAEFAVHPKIIPDLFQQVLGRNVKNVILPKPVTSDKNLFNNMLSEAEANKTKTAVASNWFYSSITSMTKTILDAVKSQGTGKAESQDVAELASQLPQGLEIEEVRLEYSKQSEVLTIPPPSQELPHALQIIHSTGLTDFDRTILVLNPKRQSESCVNVRYGNIKGVKNGIQINSDLNKGDRTDEKRERYLRVYLNDDDPEADIVADYNAEFDSEGNCTRLPSVSLDINKGGEHLEAKIEIDEDNLESMYEKIFRYFKTGDDTDVLTLEKFQPVQEQIAVIQNIWSDIIAQKPVESSEQCELCVG